MKSRIQLLTFVLLVVTAGCSGPGLFNNSQAVYKMCAASVTDVPGDATVIDASDRRIQDVESVQQAISQATENASESESGPMRCVSMTESEYATANDRLQKTPLYHGDPHEAWGFNSTGLYVATNETVVRVEMSESKLG